MKILYFCSDPGIPVLGRHGGSVHVRSMVAALERAGHSVILAATLLNKSPGEAPAPVSAPVLHLATGAETASVAFALKMFNQTLGVTNSLSGELTRILCNKDLCGQLRNRFADDPPDLIYERASLFGTAGVQLARQLSRPLAVELNAPLALEQATYRSACLAELAAQAERWTLSQADLVLVVSAALREYVVGLGVDPGRVHVVPNGIDPVLFQPRSSGGRNDQAGPVIGFIGGLRPWHGVDVLPALLDRLAPRHHNLRLVIAGDGPLRRELERDLDQRGLSPQVRFTGAVPHEEVAELICGFDVALAPYPRPEHPFYFSPLKLFEYMACGAPVAAPRLGQIAELVRDGETGLLYPPGELDGLAAACDRLLSDPALRRRLGQAAVAEVHGRYTWNHNAARVTELVRSLPKTSAWNR